MYVCENFSFSFKISKIVKMHAKFRIVCHTYWELLKFHYFEKIRFGWLSKFWTDFKYKLLSMIVDRIIVNRIIEIIVQLSLSSRLSLSFLNQDNFTLNKLGKNQKHYILFQKYLDLWKFWAFKKYYFRIVFKMSCHLKPILQQLFFRLYLLINLSFFRVIKICKILWELENSRALWMCFDNKSSF